MMEEYKLDDYDPTAVLNQQPPSPPPMKKKSKFKLFGK